MSGTVNTSAEQTKQGLEALVERLSGGYRSVGDMVYEVLREAIDTGLFAPGEWLRQESLAEMLAVSRIPVRSALIQLESEGLVVLHPRRGAQVRALSAEQIREAYELRALFEPHALRKSMATMTPERLRRLCELADELDTHGEGSAFLETRLKFYRELYDAPNNPTLTKLIEDLRNSIGRYLLGKRISTHTEHIHRHLVEQVASGDADAAVATLLAHIDKVRTGVEQMLAE